LDFLPVRNRIRRASTTLGVVELVPGTRDVDRALARDAPPTLLLRDVTGDLTLTLLRR
jgi:hypothetical protein